MTALETFKLFLEGIRNQYTSEILPETFNRFFNEQQLKWIDSIQDEVERHQRRQDQLSIISVDLDSLPLKPLYKIAETDEVKVFPIPEITANVPDGRYLYDAENKMTYPHYIRLRNLYGLLADGTKVKLEHLDTNEEDVLLENTYTKPSLDMCYYIESDGQYLLRYGKVWKVHCGDIEITHVGGSYLRRPRKFFIDESKTDDNARNLDNEMGGGSVPCEFGDIQTLNIIDFAVREALERRSNPRFKTFSENQILRQKIT